MAAVHHSWLVNPLAQRAGTFRPNCATLFLLLALGLQSILAAAQTASSPQAKKPTQGSSTPAAAEPTSPPPAQIWLPPLQSPSHQPVIDWNGKLLTIDADNSSLSDILIAIRSRTGTPIDMPASAKTERVAVHLGPASIRDVISALLYGTDFNYVIQSSEDDATALERVIVTASDDQGSEDMLTSDPSPKGKVRMMRGWAAPGKRDFEVAHANSQEENSSTVAEPASEPSPDQSPVADAADSATTNPQTENQPSTANATNPSSSTESNNTSAASDQSVSHGETTEASGSADSSGGAPSIADMEQNMQKMYQQRQQLQAQQNRAAQTPPE